MNRNIITAADVANYRAAVHDERPRPVTLTAQPPAAGVGADGYLTRLLKYVPPEVIGFLVFVVGVVQTGADGPRLPYFLLGALVVTVVVGVLYSVFALNVRRVGQLVVGASAVLVYDLAVGGWSRTQSWFEPWYGSIALALFAVVVPVLPVSALPSEPDAPAPGSGVVGEPAHELPAATDPQLAVDV